VPVPSTTISLLTLVPFGCGVPQGPDASQIQELKQYMIGESWEMPISKRRVLQHSDGNPLVRPSGGFPTVSDPGKRNQ
jgi:hypothetical protein